MITNKTDPFLLTTLVCSWGRRSEFLKSPYISVTCSWNFYFFCCVLWKWWFCMITIAFSIKKKSMNFVLNRRLSSNLLMGIIPDAFCGASASNYNYLYVKSFHIICFILIDYMYNALHGFICQYQWIIS